MSKANPRKAMAALLPLPIRCGQDTVVRPMTLGMYAALERIGSPLVTGEDPKDALELIPSLYLLTHDPREVFRENILDAAMQWADRQPLTAMEAIKAACYRQIEAARDVIPEADESAPKKKRTDGSHSSHNGPSKVTAGDTRRSSGKSRSPRSACSDGPKD